MAQLTVVSSVTDALVLRVKHSLLQHPQNDDCADPELDAQQVPPVTGAPQQPKGAKQHIHDAHGHEELKWGSRGVRSCAAERVQHFFSFVEFVFVVKRYDKPSSGANQLARSSHVVLSSQLSLGRGEKKKDKEPVSGLAITCCHVCVCPGCAGEGGFYW